MSQRLFTRRNFLGVLAAAGAGSVLAACAGQTASPTAAPAAPTKPAAAATTTAPAAGATTAPAGQATKPAAGATTAPGAAATPATAAQPAAAGAGGTPIVWLGVDYLPEVSNLMEERFKEIAQQKNFQVTVEQLQGTGAADRFNASIQANTPPDIYGLFDYQVQYWRIQGQTADVTDIVRPYAARSGGFWDPVELTCVYEGKWYGVPRAVNAWPFHARQDLLEQAGLQYPKDWDEFRQQGRQLTQGQLNYYGMTLGKINDTNNHVLGMIWTYGGKIQNDDGTLAVKENDETWLEPLRLIQAMYNEDKIIPQGAINWDDGANNQAFQSEQLVLTSNPTSIYNWLRQNKPEIAEKTRFYGYPAGPAGAVGQVDVWALGLFKNGKGGENARHLLSGYLEPEWYQKYINEQLKGRFIPVYKDMMTGFWQSEPLYKEYQNIIQNARIMSYSARPQGATAELTTRYIIGDMMQDLLVKRETPQQALSTFVKAAQEIYNKPENRL